MVLPALEAALAEQHVVLIGDSVLRYQYLSLAYTLATGTLPDFEFYLVERRTATPEGRWDAFLNRTSHLLNVANRQAHEYCDCARPGNDRFIGIENRYFHLGNAGKRIHITFYNWQEVLHGSWQPTRDAGWPAGEGMHQNFSAGSCPSGRAGQEAWPTACTWRYGPHAAAQFLQDVVMALRPRPSLVIINRGLWGRLDWPEFHHLLEAGRHLGRTHSGVRFLWRTTPLTIPTGKAATGVQPLSWTGYAKRAKTEICKARNHGWLASDAFQMSTRFTREDTHDGIHFTEVRTACLNVEFAKDVQAATWNGSAVVSGRVATSSHDGC